VGKIDIFQRKEYPALMRARISPHVFSGTVRIPASKSHTIRRLIIASLAEGVSQIMHPLDSLDAQSCAAACRVLGADITENREQGRLVSYTVEGDITNAPSRGVGHKIQRSHGAEKFQRVQNGSKPLVLCARRGDDHHSSRLIDVGNSGTTLYLAMAAAGLSGSAFEFTGDEQIQRRSAAPLLSALSGLGIRAESVRGNGCVPAIIQGPWKGGRVSLPCPTSQYLSAILLSAPLAPAGTVTEIAVPLLNERPYVEMTLSYLSAQGIPWDSTPDFSSFVIPGGAVWKPLSGPVPGDFSSAAFPACAAAISGAPVTILGLDPHDLQGDKFFLKMLSAMGCTVNWEKDADGYRLTVSRSGPLCGGNFDLNATPDLLPAAAVTAAFAEGDTALVNVAHARIKETDRIAMMAAELAKLGVHCTERPDGLIVHGRAAVATSERCVAGGCVDGHGDHRIVMAFAAAALSAQSPIEIDSAECAAVTYPGFLDLLQAEYPSLSG
jgi:3-phosphoshikimate 1-carboxyvinyltransferase